MGKWGYFMEENDKIFLTRSEAIRAVCLDLVQYRAQPILFGRLARLVLGEDRVVSEDKGRGGLWVKSSSKGKPSLALFDDMADYLCEELKKSDPPLRTLADICSCVFQEKAWVRKGEKGEKDGIVVKTGGENFECRQCGHCCNLLDYRDELTDEDCRLWQELGRTDILERVKVFRNQDEIVGYAIWMDPATGLISDRCPWLSKNPEKNRHACLIHDVRPRICRQYPGTRKHARMTGCPGFGD